MASVRNGVGGGKGVVGVAMTSQGVVALAAALTAVSLVESAYAGKNVQVDRVTKGSATFEQNGGILNIRAGDRTVINYKRFDVANGETVRFIQPSRTSRVLNRIDSAAPSRIDGTIRGNGIVYFVNPAGVMFGANAVINVGQFYAAAGNITDANFLNNVNQFKATGAVVNAGVINADAVALIGRSVANAGTISAEGGLVTMVAGDDIMLGTRDGHIMVKLASSTPAKGGEVKGGVTNTGTVNAGSTTLAAGDLYALAIGGSVKSKSVSAVGGGNVAVTGKIDASGAKGGNVVVTGKNVELKGAAIDASGTNGGGTVLVGGDYQGKGETPRANNTVVDNGTTITANATGNGDGGKVVVWADNKTTYNGSIYAKGGSAGGNGGQVEVSGKGTLAFNGQVDTTAPKGAKGSLLLDPLNLSIEASNPDVHGDGSNQDVTGDVAAGDDSGNNSIITAGQLVTLLDTTDVSLAATNDINVNAAVDASGNAGSHGLTLDAGHDVNVNQPIFLNNANLTLNAGHRVFIDTGADVGVGTGDVFINSGGDVAVSATSPGSIVANHLTVEAATGIGTIAQPLVVGLTGGLEAHTTTGDIAVSSNGSIDLGFAGGTKGGVIADAGNVRVVANGGGSLFVRTAGERVAAGGNVFLFANGDVVTDNFDGVGAGQVSAAGSVTIDAGGDVTIGATSAGDVHAGNGLSISANAGTITIDNGSFVEADAGNLFVTAGVAVNLAQTLLPGAHVWDNGTGLLKVSTPSFGSASGAVPAAVRGGGQVLIEADTVDFTDDIESTSTTDWVQFRTYTAGRGISLADGPVAGQLTLTGTQLSHVKTGFGLTIGEIGDGDISIAGTINEPASGWHRFRLLTSGSISDAAGGTLQVDTLATESATGVALDNQTHFIGTFSGNNSTSGAIAVKSAGDLTIERLVAGGAGNDLFVTSGGHLFKGPGTLSGRNMTLEAATGIGTPSDAFGGDLTGGLEAHATTGDMFLSGGFPGTLNLGFAGGTKGGVVADDGNVWVINFGSIRVTTADHPVVASGDVELISMTGTVVTDNFSGTGAGQISAGGKVTLNGSNGVTIGETTFGDVHAGTGLTIQANAGTVTIDNGSFVETDAGDASVSAGTAVSLAQSSTPGAHLWNNGTGQISISAPSFSSASGAVPASVKGGGGITIKADTVGFTDNIESTSTTEAVAFRTYTVGRGISLADGPVAGQLTLTGTQLSRVKAPYAIMIGDNSSGDISIAGTINQPGSGWNRLLLVTGGMISDVAGGTLQVDTLGTISALGTELNHQTHFVGTFTANNTTFGGIQLKNSGDLDIGGFGTLSGVHASGPGGVVIDTTGVLSITSSGDTVTAAGGVSLSGLDVVTGGGNSPAVQSNTDAVVITATRDVLIGSGGDFGDVQAASDLTITAGRDVIIDEGSLVSTSSGNLIVSGGQSVQLLQTTSSGARIENTGTGPITISAPSFVSTSGGVPASVKGGGQITIKADTVNFSDNIETTSTTDWVAFRTYTAGRGISLADGPVAGQLTLTGTQLSHVKAPYAVMIGDVDNGDISVAGTINQPASGWNRLMLVTGGAISDAAGGTIQVDTLATYSFTGTTLNNQTHFVGTFAANNFTSGGIALSNSGDLAVGALGPATGIDAAGAGGVTIETTGVLSVTGNTVTAVGDIALSGQDVVTGGGNSPAVESTAGAVTIDATRDVLLGSGGDLGDVHAATGLTISAGRDVIIDEGSVASTDAGNVSVSGDRSVQLLQTTAPGARIENAGAGTITISTPSFVSTGGAVPASVKAAGQVTIEADSVDFTDKIVSTGDDVLFRTYTAGRGISLADSAVAGQLTLTGSQLQRVEAGSGVVVIGDANSGNISVAGTINQQASGWDTLHLVTGGSVSDAAGGTIQADNLAVEAHNGIILHNQTHFVGTFAASNTLSGGVTFANGLTLTVGAVDGVTGVTSVVGDVALIADKFDVASTITATGHTVTFQSLSSGVHANIGSLTDALVNTFELSQAELANVSANRVRISADGNVDVSDAIDGTGHWNELTLDAGGNVSQSSTITVGSLAAIAGGSVDLGDNNDVGTVAGSAGGTFSFHNIGALTVGTVDGQTGIAAGANVTLTAGGNLTLVEGVTTGGGDFSAAVTGGGFTAQSPNGTIDTIGVNEGNNAGDVTITATGAVDIGTPLVVTGRDSAAGDAGTGGDVNITGSSVTLGSVDTSGGSTTHTGSLGGSAGAVTITSTSGTITLNGNVNAAGGQGDVSANNGDDANVTVDGPVVLGNNVTVTGADIEFTDTIQATTDGGQALTIINSGLTKFSAAVGNTFKLSSLTVSGASQIDGGTVSTTGAQAYTGAVKLGANTALTGGTILFGSTVDSFNSTARTLTLHNSGLATFGGAVGGTNILSTLTVDGASAINGGVVKTQGAQLYTGPVTLNADTALTGTTITFNSTVDSFNSTGRGLTLHNSGVATFNGAVGGSHALSSLTVDGASTLNGSAVTTTGDQTYTGAVTLAKDTTLTGDDVTFVSTINGTTNGSESLAIINGGTATFGGNVGSTIKLESLSVSGATTVAGGGSIVTTGDQSYGGAFSTAVNLTLTGDDVTFGSTVRGLSNGGQSLAVNNAGLLTFNGAIGDASKALSSLTVDGPIVLNGGSVRTTGNQTYNGAVTVKSDNTLTGATFLFASSVNGASAGAQSLTINNTGVATFNTSIGTGTSLKSLSLTGASMLKGSQVVTTGSQTYGGAVTLNGTDDVTMTGTAITFGSTLDATTDAGQGLTLNNSAVATFGGAAGGTHKLKFLTVNGASAINGSGIATAGAQSYVGAVTVGGNTTLTGTTITFVKTVDDSADGGHTLTLANTGPATFGGAVGATQKLGGLSVAGPASIQGGIVNTSGSQTYSGAVVLTRNTTMTAGANVTFSQTVDGAVVLHVTTGSAGTVTFAGNVGGTNPLKGLSTSGKTKFGAHGQTTSVVVSSPDNGTAADVSVGGNLTVAGDVTVRIATGAKRGVRFGGDIDGEQAGQDSLTVLVPWHERTDGTSGNVLNLPLITFATPGIGTRSQLRALRLNATQAADPSNIVPGTDPAGGINADARTPLVATVFAPGGLDVSVAEDFTMGHNEKLTAGHGDVVVAAGSTATVGDINAPGDITVSAPKIVLQQRAASAVYNKVLGDTTLDTGLDFVAGGNIKFTGTFVETDPAHSTVTFAYGGDTDPGIVRGQLTRPIVRRIGGGIDDAAMTTQITVNGETVIVPLDFPPAGPSIEDPATTIAGATHIALPEPGTEPGISAAQMALLAQIGINARELTDLEILDGLQGRDIYVQAPGGLDIASGRLYSRVVTDVLETYSTFFMQEQTSGVDGQTATVDTRIHMHEVLTKAVDTFNADRGSAAFDPIAFRSWCESTFEQKGAADALNKLRTLLVQIEYLGLTDKEMSQVKAELFKKVKPDGVSMGDFTKAVMGRVSMAR